jgi:hypothetical protein
VDEYGEVELGSNPSTHAVRLLSYFTFLM